MANDAPLEVVRVVVQGREVVLDPANMKYDENSLGEYMSKEYAWVDYLGKQLEYAQKETLYGNSDNYAKAFALADAEVVAAKKKVADCKEKVGHIKAHLYAFSKNHDNAQNRGHTIRQEMKVLSREHYEDVPTCVGDDFLSK